MKKIISLIAIGFISYSCGDKSPISNSKNTTALNTFTGPTSPITFPPNPSNCTSNSCDSAILACGSTNSITISGTSFVDGTDHYLPFLPCTGSGCNAFLNPSTSSNYDLLAEGSLTVQGTGVTFQGNLGNSAHCSEWGDLYNQWLGTNACSPGVIYVTDSTYSGESDCYDPKVYVFRPTSGTVTINGNTSLCGAFFIDGNLLFGSAGTQTLAGVVIAMNRSQTLNMGNPQGAGNIYGKVISNGQVLVNGYLDIEFSSQGMASALQALNNASLIPVSCDPAPTLF